MLILEGLWFHVLYVTAHSRLIDFLTLKKVNSFEFISNLFESISILFQIQGVIKHERRD